MSTIGKNLSEAGSLMSAFSARSGVVGFDQSQKAPSSTPKSTMLGALNPSLKTSVGATAVSAQKVSMHQSASGAQVTAKNSAMQGLKSDVKATKAAISATIKQAQGEVAAAMKDVGASSDMYQSCDDMAIAGGMVADAALGGGMGTIITCTQAATSTLVDTVTSSKETFKSKAEAEVAIETRLRDMSTAVSANHGFVQDQGSAPSADGGADWNKCFDDGHKLKNLMATNPDDPSEALFPEVAALNTLEHNIDDVLENNSAAKVKFDGPHCSLAGGSLRDIQGLQFDRADSFNAAAEAVAVTKALNYKFEDAARQQFAPAAFKAAFA